MKRIKKHSLVWLEFELLEEFSRLKHAMFLRSGGYSEGCFASLNFDDRQDMPENVRKNEALAYSYLPLEQVYAAEQCHAVSIVNIDIDSPALVPDCDALTTSCKGAGLLMTHADCQVTLIYDPIGHAIASVHAGWRGLVAGIYEKTIRRMEAVYGSKPSDLLFCVSPSLGPEASQFIHYKTEFPSSFWDFQFKPFYFDLWAIAEKQAKQAGILSHHIEIARLCTYNNPEDFFSYRRDKKTGRHGTLVVLT